MGSGSACDRLLYMSPQWFVPGSGCNLDMVMSDTGSLHKSPSHAPRAETYA